MDEYKSQYDELMESLKGRIRVYSPEENYLLITELNKEMYAETKLNSEQGVQASVASKAESSTQS